MIYNNIKVCLAQHEFEIFDDEALIFTEDKRIITLNKLATFIWITLRDNVNNSITTHHIVNSIIDKFELDTSLYNTIHNDVSEYMEQLLAEGLLLQEDYSNDADI